ncbi:MAG: isoprenyl transferase, partial [Bacteroidetes bacterium]|nr:isoprenyl transferase [Bacteroidota bacterium]
LYAFSTENWNRPVEGSECIDGIIGPYDLSGKET